jgi:adenosylmethionine-8-amino-7-oxononanoate aminotransferase
LVKQLEPLVDSTTAILIEPIVQGAGGMKIYSQDFLRRLRKWTQEHHIHLIADEIMTGIGRTGKMLACEHAAIEPDFICLAKGLTSGWLPLSAVLTSTEIYNLFYADYSAGKNFLHSHTQCGNALAVSVALETLNIMEEEKICTHVQMLEPMILKYMREIAETTGKLTNVRGIGAIVAADLMVKDQQRRIGFEIYQQAVKRGALLRPLGNTIYWLPPLNIEHNTLQDLKEITQAAIQAVRF